MNEQDDPFLELTSIQQFESRIASYKRTSLSKLSTANNTTFATRKSTLFEGSPTVGFLDTFVEKIHFLATRCNEQIDRSECAKITLDFGLSLYKIQTLPLLRDREDYIVDSLQHQVSDQLRQWNNRIEQRELQRNKTRAQSTDENNLDWLEVHSRFRALKQKLKFALIEAVQNSNKDGPLKYQQPNMQLIVNELQCLLHRIDSNDFIKPLPFETWNDQNEIQFKQHRSQAQKRLGQIVKSNSMSIVGFGEQIITYDKGLQEKLRRNELLQKYNSNQQLSEEELLYLVNTSTLMQKCLDKKLIQTVISHLDQEIVSDIELSIAENILSQYYRAKKGASINRLNYLRQQKQFKIISKPIQKQCNENLKHLKVKITRMLRKISNKKNIIQYTQQYDQFYPEYKRGNPIANPYVWKFKDIMMGILEKKKRERRDKKLVSTKGDLNKQIFPSKKENLTIKIVMRKTHPSSKLIMKSQPDLLEHKNEGSQYRLKKSELQREKQSFTQFYSGGPIRQRPFANSWLQEENSVNESLPCQKSWITPEIEIIAINKIKKALKVYLFKKRLERKKRDNHQNTQPNKFLKLLKKLQEQRKPIDVEECYKNLRIAIQFQKRKKTIKKTPQIDYSKVSIPKNMIQLKLKQRKLFLALKVNNTLWTEQSGFIFEPSDINCYDVDMYSPLYYAAQKQNVTFCNFLLTNGADVNMPCKNGDTPTHAAFHSGNIIIINLFISNGADIDRLNKEGKTPLCYCSVELLRELNLQHRICVIRQ